MFSNLPINHVVVGFIFNTSLTDKEGDEIDYHLTYHSLPLYIDLKPAKHCFSDYQYMQV